MGRVELEVEKEWTGRPIEMLAKDIPRNIYISMDNNRRRKLEETH